MALFLEEEDTSFTKPDLPMFSSAEENSLSIMGRTLNPEYQENDRRKVDCEHVRLVMLCALSAFA